MFLFLMYSKATLASKLQVRPMDRATLQYIETNLSHKTFYCQIPSISTEDLALSRLICYELSRFSATATAFFCSLTYAG